MDQKKTKPEDLEGTAREDEEGRVELAEGVFEGGYYSEITPEFPDAADEEFVGTAQKKKEKKDDKEEN